jgi:hypothetical protein
MFISLFLSLFSQLGSTTRPGKQLDSFISLEFNNYSLNKTN